MTDALDLRLRLVRAFWQLTPIQQTSLVELIEQLGARNIADLRKPRKRKPTPEAPPVNPGP